MSNNDKEFVAGLYAKKPLDSMPDFVKATVGVKWEEFLPWLRSKRDENPGAEWLNLELLEAKSGESIYFSVNNYEGSSKKKEDLEIPF